MTAYYNEIDPYAAQWLRNLIAAGHIAPGDVDERSIEDVLPNELAGYTQCHFFAGIGGWSLALRLAGWPDDKPVWTGSCPCQPFSSAGKGVGFADERHLWPAFHYLIEQCRPPVVFGEQVASKDGLAWLDLVQADLEGTGYAVGAADLCAAGVGAPHIRQRLWFVADSEYKQHEGRISGYGADTGAQGCRTAAESTGHRETYGMGYSIEPGLEGQSRYGNRSDEPGRLDAEQNRPITEAGKSCGMAHPEINGRQGQYLRSDRESSQRIAQDSTSGERPCPTNGFWRDADWLFCRDGKWRPVEPGTFPLVNGIPGRVGLLRGYGNSIVPQEAQAFIESWLEA